MSLRAGLTALLLAATWGGCERAAPPPEGPRPPSGARSSTPLPVTTLRFADVSDEVGLDFVHPNARSERKHLPETMAGGGGFLDVDGDGVLEIYLVRSAWLPKDPAEEPPPGTPGDVLLRLGPDGRFEDVTAAAGLGDPHFGMGAYAADADGDGDGDLLVTNFGRNTFWRNQGDGTFVEQGERVGLGDRRWSTAAAWFDGDGDGDLDLYVCNYLRYLPSEAPRCSVPGTDIASYCSPKLFDGEEDALLENLGDGTFRDVSREAGVAGFRGKGLGVIVLDLGRDGDADLVVTNDTTPTLLFENQGGMRFEEAGARLGIAYSEDGVARAGMGVDHADVDGDGLDDVFVTNFAAEVNALYRQTDAGFFVERSRPSGLGAISFPFLGFGCLLEDFDLDGDPDVVVANGHVLDTAELSNRATTYRQRPFLFENDGRGVFREVGAAAGAALRRAYCGRGLATGDFDGDGDPDLLLLQVGDRARLLRNDSRTPAHRLAVLLVGRPPNRDAVGARVRADAAGRVVLREVRPARSYLSTHDRTLFFGFPSETSKARLDVTWPGGEEEVVDVPVLDRRLVVEQGRGVVRSTPLR